MSLPLKFKIDKRLVTVTLLCLIAILVVNSFLAFSSNVLQEWFRFILKIGILVLLIKLCFLQWKARIVSIVVSVIFLILFLTPLALITIMVVFSQLPGSGFREELYSISLQNKDLVVYQNNCGATCAFGLDVAIEKHYIFGVFQTRNFIHHYYPGNDLTLKKIGPNSVQVVFVNIEKSDRQLSETVPVEGEVWDLSSY